MGRFMKKVADPPAEPPAHAMGVAPLPEPSGPGIVLPKDTRETPATLRPHCHRLAAALRAEAASLRQNLLVDQAHDLDTIELIGRLEQAAKVVLSWSGLV